MHMSKFVITSCNSIAGLHKLAWNSSVKLAKPWIQHAYMSQVVPTTCCKPGVDNLQQASTINNSQQVCDYSNCVYYKIYEIHW